jgi:hypothetical protein
MRCWLITMCFVVLALNAALAQHKKAVSPQAQSTDKGPSLEVTTKFIQDKLAEQGVFHFILYMHNNQSGQDESAQRSFEVTSLNLDPANCKFESNYKIKVTDAGWITGMRVLPLQSIKQVQVMPGSNWWTQELADEGYPMKTARVEPPLFMLSLGQPHNGPGTTCTTNDQPVACPDPTWADRLSMTWSFHDEDTANRVAKAVVHAVELCDGGSKPEPF